MENKIEENVEVSIRETQKKTVIDMNISLNTMQSGKAEFVTKKINGILKAAIINSNANVQIQISLLDNEKVILFEDVNFFGSQYLPLSTEQILKRNEKLQYSATDWILNDKLKIVVKGPFNSLVKFKLRYV